MEQEINFIHSHIFSVDNEAWKRPGVRFAALSRIDWLDKGCRKDFVTKAYQLAAQEGCQFIVINGGVIDGHALNALIKDRLELVPKKERTHEARERIIADIADEVASVFPVIKRPQAKKTDRHYCPYVRTYVIPSPVLDGKSGIEVIHAVKLIRDDFRVYSEGSDVLRLKGIDAKAKDVLNQMFIRCVNPIRPGMPSEYASSSPEKIVKSAAKGRRVLPDFWISGGFGSSTYKPGCGKERPIISQPVLCSPTSVEPGEPSLGVNMVGLHIIEIARDGKTRAVKTWSFSDLLKDELSVISLDETTSTPLQRNIVAAMVSMTLKDESGKYTVGEITDVTHSTDEEVEKALEPLKTVEALSGSFPGLYFNPQSQRYSFHREWFQKHLVYPWPYDQYQELRRLSFGCLHVGYITTDYEYVRTRFTELILSLKVDVLELVGDIIAGRKHDLPERRQLVGDMNYDDQEQFAGELLASVLYDVFCKRFQAEMSGMASGTNTPATCLSREQILECANKSFVTFAYIVGNHDTWVTAHGHTPAITFHLTLCSKLAHMLSLYLEDFNIPYRSVVDLLKQKILRLAEKKRVKDKEDSKASLAMYGYEMNGITVDMIHPYMPNAQTTSVRCEQVIRHSSANCVAVANFHKGVFVEVYHPEYGVQAASQAPCMLPFGTEFEDSKLKAVDFGPIFTVVRARKGRIFYVEKMYFDDPIMTEPFDPFTNPRKLKRDLRIDPNPWLE